METGVRTAGPPGNASGKEVLAAVLLLVARLLVRMALSSRAMITGDSLRFLSQAKDLAAGTADLSFGEPFSAVPPGYPLFIRAVGWITPGVEFLLHVQLLLSVLTLLFVGSRPGVGLPGEPSWRSPSWP